MQGKSVTLRSLGILLRLFLVCSLILPAPAVLAQDNIPPSSNPASSASRADSTEPSSHCERLFSGAPMDEFKPDAPEYDLKVKATSPLKLSYSETKEEETVTKSPEELCAGKSMVEKVQCVAEMMQKQESAGATTKQTRKVQAKLTINITPHLLEDSSGNKVLGIKVASHNLKGVDDLKPESKKQVKRETKLLLERLEDWEKTLDEKDVSKLEKDGSLPIRVKEPFSFLNFLSKPKMQVTVSGTFKPTNGKCSELLLKAVLEDFSNSIARECSLKHVQPPAIVAPSQLENFMKHQLQFYDEQSYSQNVADSCDDNPLVQPNNLTNMVKLEGKKPEIFENMVAEYYWSKKRLTDGVMASLKNMMALEKLQNMSCDLDKVGQSLGGHPLRDIKMCRDYDAVSCGAYFCRKLKQECTDAVNYAAVIDQAELAQREREAILKQIQKNRQGARKLSEYILFAPKGEGQTKLNEQHERLLQDNEKLYQLIKVIESTNNWLQSDKFNERYKDALNECQEGESVGEAFCDEQKQTFVCEGIKAEAAETRNAIKDHLADFNQAIKCLEGQECDLDTSEFRKIIDKAPPFSRLPEPPEDAGVEDRKEIRHATNLFEQIKCRNGLREASEDAQKAWNDFIVGSSLTVLTAGFGEIALSIRAASTAASASKVARGLEVAAWVLDASDMSRGIIEGIEQCNDKFSMGQLSALSTPRGPPCPGGQDYAGPLQAQGYNLCVLETVAIELGTGILPAVPSGIKGIKNALRTAKIRTAKRASNLVDSHADAFSRVARNRDEYILTRPVNPDSTEIIAKNGATKGFNIKGKSSDWGLQKAYVPYEQKYSKLAKKKDKIEEYNKYNKKAIEEGHAIKVKIEKDGKVVTVVKDKAGKEHIVFSDEKGGFFDPNTGKKMPADQFEGPGEPLWVMGDPKTGQPFTADYDLLAIGSKKPRGEFITDKNITSVMGGITADQIDTVNDLNKAVKLTGHEGGKVVHHGPEVQNPKPEPVDSSFPITAFEPDGNVVTILEGPPGDPWRNLKDYFHHVKQQGYNLEPNPAWEWGDYDPKTGWT